MHRTTLGTLTTLTLVAGLAIAAPHLTAEAVPNEPVLGPGETPVRTHTVPLAGRFERIAGSRDAASTPALTPGSFRQVAVTWHGDVVPDVEIRTRSGAGWSTWSALEPMVDGDAGEGNGTQGTDLVWTGAGSAVQVRTRGPRPRDLTLVAVDPGTRRTDTAPEATAPDAPVPGGARPRSYAAGLLPVDALVGRVLGAETSSPSPSPSATTASHGTDHTLDSPPPQNFPAHHAPRPALYNRSQWGANESLRNAAPVYSDTINTVHVHHTVSVNSYKKWEVPSMIRGMYAYHTKTLGWADIGYNFLVDKYGRVWEGRAGGVNDPVRGAHTLGFNWRSVGISVIGDHTKVKPTPEALSAIIKLSAWKLDLYGRWPAGYTWTVSEGSDRYPEGKVVRLHTMDGHRDTNDTACPGWYLYERLSYLRKYAAQRAAAY